MMTPQAQDRAETKLSVVLGQGEYVGAEFRSRYMLLGTILPSGDRNAGISRLIRAIGAIS